VLFDRMHFTKFEYITFDVKVSALEPKFVFVLTILVKAVLMLNGKTSC